MSNTLELVRAGAGAGKTYDLCETVAQAVVDGLDPARILATTFTNKAAAELEDTKDQLSSEIREHEITQQRWETAKGLLVQLHS